MLCEDIRVILPEDFSGFENIETMERAGAEVTSAWRPDLHTNFNVLMLGLLGILILCFLIKEVNNGNYGRNHN